MVQIFKEYRFEAAHRLPHVPPDHPCSRLHGHSYRVVLRLEGPLDPQLGWVLDFAELDDAFLPLRAQLDHYYLNDIEGLDNPTCEILAQWLWRRLVDSLEGLRWVEVWETADAGCRYQGPDGD
jgi:6-pyruvoyltetrahydropterin/6-carboxytetrahydropterin synthase